VWRKYRGVWRKLEKSGENCKSGGEKKIIHVFQTAIATVSSRLVIHGDFSLSIPCIWHS
jgi:hypothetical protein